MYRLKRNNSAGAVLLVLVSLAALGASCATGSKQYNTGLDQQDPFAALDPGATAYLYVDVPQARSLLDSISLPGMKGMDKKQLAQVFDRTSSVVAAYYPETAPRRFLAAAQGSYPNFHVNTSFTFSTAWKKRRSQTGDSYWHSAKDKLSVSLSGKRAFVSDGDPFVFSPGVRVPEDFAPFREGAALAGWLEDGALPINQFLKSLEIPIQIPAGQVLFGVQRSEMYYEADIRLETPSVSQAKALAAIFNMARLFMPPSNTAEEADPDPLTIAGTLFANPPVQEGPYLSLHTGLLNEKGMALLFTLLSVYSNQNQ